MRKTNGLCRKKSSNGDLLMRIYMNLQARRVTMNLGDMVLTHSVSAIPKFSFNE